MVQNLIQMGIKGTEEWFFGPIRREQANEILLKEALGMYLIRCSSEPGNFALSVRDKHKASHYKITASRRQTQEGYKFRIGSLDFISIHHIVEYYKKNKLGDSTLTVPAPRLVYRARFDYKPDSSDTESSEDLCLRRNECVLFIHVMDGDENNGWWRVSKRNTGEVGYVPSTYLRQSSPDESDDDNKFAVLLSQLATPMDVQAMRCRNPNMFDPTQLRLEVGDIVRVKQVSRDQPELWLGVNLRSQLEGLFPFNYVRPLLDPAAAAATAACHETAGRCSCVSSSGSSRGGGNRASQASGGALDDPPTSAVVAAAASNVAA